jgi:hypothetical protein
MDRYQGGPCRFYIRGPLTIACTIIHWAVFRFMKIPNKLQQLKEDEKNQGQAKAKEDAIAKPSEFNQARIEYLCIWVTCINSTISASGGLWYAITVGLRHPDEPFDSFEYFFVTMNIAYFTYDTILQLSMGHKSFEFLLHHIMAIIGFSTPVVYAGWSCFAVYGMFVAEISGPCLTMRKILPWVDNFRSWVPNANDINFMVVFITAR